jgi:hypothetical protein
MRRLIHSATPRPATLVALLALFAALGGTSYAALAITGKNIKDGSITSADIRNRSLRPADFNRAVIASIQGAKGDPGPIGPKGSIGPKGDKGDKGDKATLPSGIQWIDHFSFLAGDSSVQTTHEAVSSGVGSGLTALVVTSNTPGENAPSGGNTVIHRALEVPPGYTIKGVRVCYELTNARSFISQIRLAQIQDPPSSAIVRLDDATDLTDEGPVCVDSAPTSVDPSKGQVLLDLRVNFGGASDKIAIRAVGLHLAS